MNTTLPVWAPLMRPAEVDDAVAALQAAGVRRRSLGVVDLKLRPRLEPEPPTRRALAAIGRETLRIVVLALPVVVMVKAALLMPSLSDRPTLTVGIGDVARAGASPVAAIVGFALAWARWGHLANHHPGVPATPGYAVVVARSSVPAPPPVEVAVSRPAVGDRLATAEPLGNR